MKKTMKWTGLVLALILLAAVGAAAETNQAAELTYVENVRYWGNGVFEVDFMRDYLDEAGMDVDGMDDRELEEAAEVFSLPDGRFLIVEG